VYIDPNVGGMLFQSLAAVFAAITGIVFVFSRQIRSGLARLRRFFRSSKSTASNPGDKQVEE
jgi:hypothetical protein